MSEQNIWMENNIEYVILSIIGIIIECKKI